MEAADQVFAGREIDTGLSAHRTVHLGEKRCRHLHESDPAHPDRRGEPGNVSDHPAAKRDDERLAVGSRGHQTVEHLLHGGKRLIALAIRKHDTRHQGGAPAGSFDRGKV